MPTPIFLLGCWLAVFFLFLLVALYNGLNVKDDYSHKLHLTWRNSRNMLPDTGGGDVLPEMGDGDNFFGQLIVWLFATIFVLVIGLIILPFIWSGIIFLFLATYWVIIRALKLIFRKSTECEGDMLKSSGYALLYTVLYTGWIFGLIYLASLL